MDIIKIEAILGDIVSLDPELKGREKEIRKIISDIIASKPNTEIDSNFEANLRLEIIAKINEMKLRPAARAFRFPIHKLSYAAGLAVLVFVFFLSREFIPTGNHEKTYDGPAVISPDDIKEPIKIISAQESLRRVAKSAFGRISLSTSDNTATPSYSNATAAEEKAVAVSSVAAGTSPAGMESGNNAMSMDSKMMPPYEYPVFKYIYKGDAIVQDQETVDVYKRIKSSFGGQEIADYVTRLDYGMIDMKKFKGSASISNLTLNEEREFGYTLNINMTENAISLYPNWLKWSRLDSSCRDEACFASYRTKFEDIPDDEKLINIANAFLDEYGIDKNEYGKPIVQDGFRQEYEKAADKSLVYLPEEISVVYPYKISDFESVDESGNPTGLYVSINIRQARVSSLNTLTPKNFEVSAYDAITDSAKIITLAEQGGSYPSYFDEGAKKIVEISLGSPIKVLARQYNYNQTSGQSEEFFIPALSFPVINISDNQVYFYRKNVIVPIAEGMQNNDVPMLYQITPASAPMIK